jgi:hypothetical protein
MTNKQPKEKNGAIGATIFVWAVLAGLAFLHVPAVGAKDEIRTERVRFEKGASSATVEDRIVGRETVDYVLNAKEGQYMNVSMATDNAASYFNIIPPGEENVAIFIGSTSGNQYEGILPASGDYKIRVYMMRSAARRDETANYRLEMIITAAEGGGSGKEASAPAGDAKVEGTDYHATGEIPCSMAKGQPTGSCPFGVKREGNGNAIVTVTRPDGSTRSIFFQNGNAISADISAADAVEFSASREGDVSIIRIGDERYEIFDAVIFGG